MRRMPSSSGESGVGVQFAGSTCAMLGWLLLLILALSLTGATLSAQPAPSDAVLSIPAQSDWTDYGVILESGALGEWDFQLWGGFTGTAIKKAGTYYLYYQGASGYQSTPSEVVTGRAIGVATSPDGVNFTKFGGNPVVTWSPTDERGDEGPASGAVVLDDSGDFLLYYGANTAESGPTVYADARLATSGNGLDFTDQGIVLDHQDDSLYGFGDQLYPIVALRDSGQWIVYYIPWGSPEEATLGVVWGNAPDHLTTSFGAVSEGSAVRAFGMAGSARIGSDTYALFFNDVVEQQTEVRTVSLNAPHQLSPPLETYQFDNVVQATVLLDEESSTWFMYYRGENEYGLKLAPAGELDTTPPTAPGSVTAIPVSDRQVDLSWTPATDPDTGIVVYKVFRDGNHIATVKGWGYSDTGLVEQTTYSYTVSAVNYHGTEGPESTPVTATTLEDVTPPRVVSVNASGPSNRVVITFDEPVEEASATTVTNYAIDQGISVVGAGLASDLTTVVLTTSWHEHHRTYLLAVSGVRDRAKSPNTISPGTGVRYTHSHVPGLVGAWTFDEGEGETAFDTSNHGNDGALIYTDAPGPAWTDGRFGGALYFDGLDDQVTIDGTGSLANVTNESHTFTAWAWPDSLPPNSTPNNPYYSALVRNRTGLYYDHTGRFRAQIRLASGEEVAVTSDAFAPGKWHHLAMVVDDVNKRVRLYVDGEEVSNSPVGYSGPLAEHNQAPYYVGTSDPLTGRYEYRFSGRIDEAWIYDRALTQLEVQSLVTGSPISPVYLPVIMNQQ